MADSVCWKNQCIHLFPRNPFPFIIPSMRTSIVWRLPEDPFVVEVVVVNVVFGNCGAELLDRKISNSIYR